jgi:uncharacterized delta-60 repeat protein
VLTLVLLLLLMTTITASTGRQIGQGASQQNSKHSKAVREDSPATSTYWAKTYGSGEHPYPSPDYASSVQQTSDGGYIVAGTINGGVTLGPYAWVLKLEPNGSVVWAGSYGDWDWKGSAQHVEQTSDGGYILSGSWGYPWAENGPEQGDFILKLNSTGLDEWHYAYGGEAWKDEYGGASVSLVKQASDGGYVAAGSTWEFGVGNTDAWVLKLDSNGGVAWQKTYGGGGYDRATSVEPTSDGGYIVAGSTYSFGAGKDDAWVLKLDSTGGVIWQKTYGGSGDDCANSAEQTADGGYIVLGSTSEFGAGVGNVWVLKLSSTGSVTWQKTYGGGGSYRASAIEETSDGGYVVAGSTNSSCAGGWDFWVLKLNPTGSVNWQKAYGGGNDDEAYSVQQTSDGGYVAAGYTNSFGTGWTDAWVVKLGVDGYIVWDPYSGASTHITDATTSDSSAKVSTTSVTPVDGNVSLADWNVDGGVGTGAAVTTQAPDETPPATITDLAASAPTSTSIKLNWTAPGDDGNAGNATGYVVKYSTLGPINASNWASATTYTQSWVPLAAGQNETHVITGLNSNTTYWFAVETYDAAHNYAGVSNSPSATTLTEEISALLIVGVEGVAVITVVVAGVLWEWNKSKKRHK